MIYNEKAIERMLADGKITQHDADEVEHFAEFLRRSAGKTPKEKTEIYLEFYPEFARIRP
jgi:hypothetical protein